MATSDDSSSESFTGSNSSIYSEDEDETGSSEISDFNDTKNIAIKLRERQLFGKFSRDSRAKTDKVKYRFPLRSLVGHDYLNHIFMGFTLCGNYFLSITVNASTYNYFDVASLLNVCDLHLWKFQPSMQKPNKDGLKLKYILKYRMFKPMQGTCNTIDSISLIQMPQDPFKLICYGSGTYNAFMTILTLPSNTCRHCPSKNPHFNKIDDVHGGWCQKHGFILHYTFPLSMPSPEFNPYISLAYPDYLVINTGNYIHVLNITTANPTHINNNMAVIMKVEEKINNFCDTQSETSEVLSEFSTNFETNSVVDAILEDLNEYDFDGECNRPFHELNISCEPLNVTGKSYHNALVQNIVDPRMKRLQTGKDYQFQVPQSSSMKSSEKPKVDLKNAEKAYEFIEENEKCENLSLFRKKRLAEKKYEFSEDNSENIVPFNSLRRERRLFRRFRSPDFNNIFLSPRSPGIRSPMQSPSSRNGQFSPSGVSHVYCTSFRNSPYRSPISPKDTTRKFHAYSPSNFNNECDSDSRLIRQFCGGAGGQTNENFKSNSHGLLIVDPTGINKPKWMKKIVKRFSNGDFENGSLLSGHSRDDNSIPIEIPVIGETLGNQMLDLVPDTKSDHITQMQLITTQKTFDCEQFMEKYVDQLCNASQLKFLYCIGYDLKMLHVCSLEGEIVGKASVKIGAMKNSGNGKPQEYCTEFLFTWNIETDAFNVVNSSSIELCLLKDYKPLPPMRFPKVNCRKISVMNYNSDKTKTVLRDYDGNYEIVMNEKVPFMVEDSDDDESSIF